MKLLLFVLGLVLTAKSGFALYPLNCFELFALNPSLTDNSYTIYPDGLSPVLAHCQSTEDSLSKGPWTRILNRIDESIAFSRNYYDFVNGFGNLDQNYWIGLNAIHNLTSNYKMSLRIELSNQFGLYFIEYESFQVASSANKYRLSLGPKTIGNLPDSFGWHHGSTFQTYDTNESDCPNTWNGGWWFNNCYYACLTCANYPNANNNPGQWRIDEQYLVHYQDIKMLVRPSDSSFTPVSTIPTTPITTTTSTTTTTTSTTTTTTTTTSTISSTNPTPEPTKPNSNSTIIWPEIIGK